MKIPLSDLQFNYPDNQIHREDLAFAAQIVTLGNPVGSTDKFGLIDQWAYVNYTPTGSYYSLCEYLMTRAPDGTPAARRPREA